MVVPAAILRSTRFLSRGQSEGTLPWLAKALNSGMKSPVSLCWSVVTLTCPRQEELKVPLHGPFPAKPPAAPGWLHQPLLMFPFAKGYKMVSVGVPVSAWMCVWARSPMPFPPLTMGEWRNS